MSTTPTEMARRAEVAEEDDGWDGWWRWGRGGELLSLADKRSREIAPHLVQVGEGTHAPERFAR